MCKGEATGQNPHTCFNRALFICFFCIGIPCIIPFGKGSAALKRLKNQSPGPFQPRPFGNICQALYSPLGKHKVGDPLKINDDPRELLLMWVLSSDIYHFIN